VTAPRRVAPVQVSSGRARALRTLPAWIMLAVLFGAGVWRLIPIVRQSFAMYPTASTVAIVLFGLYAVPFVLLLRAIDYLKRQPALLRLAAFAWGGVVATSAAIVGGSALQDVLAKTVSPGFAAQWGPSVGAAGLEEVLKLLGVLAIALAAPRALTSVVDGFVYGALVGLGFQVIEDVLFAVNAVALNGAGDVAGPVVVTFVLRGFVGGLWSHTLFTALAGAAVAYTLGRTERSGTARAVIAVALFAAAWGSHFMWNSPWLSDGFGYGPLGGLAAVIVKGIPALVVAVLLIVAAERREADYYSALLAGLADPRIATAEEIRALVSPRRRLGARRQARSRLGLAGGHAVRRLQRAQALLAVALARDPSRQRGTEVLRRRRDVLGSRHRLVALALAGSPGNRRAAVVAASGVIAAETLAVAIVVAGIGLAIQLLGGA
jgi:RsiW-degrading membrane proteinase PrsW (M82 family)